MALVPEPARALERLLARRRELLAALLSLDGEDRWGARDEASRASIDARSAQLTAAHRANDAALAALAERTRRDAPDALRRWAEAHVELLDAYVAGLDQGPATSTERSVAAAERAQWLDVALGTRLFAEENTFYVHVDRALHDALFGLGDR